jgi:TrmH family RNA methyltransferase
MKLINSTDNKDVKYAASLLQKKYRDRENRFLIEGYKSMEAADKRLIETVFVDSSKQMHYENYINDPEINCCLVDQKIMRKICDTDSPQGIAAIVKKPEAELDTLLKAQGLLILLDRITDPGNMGTIIRSAWALNAGGILAGPGCVDVFSPKVVRATMGGIFNLPVITDFSLDQIRFCQDKGYTLVCTDIQATRSFYDVDYTKKKILIIGNEAAGVSNELKNLCDEFIKIPVNPTADSLNAAVACAIILQEAFRQRSNGYSCVEKTRMV